MIKKITPNIKDGNQKTKQNSPSVIISCGKSPVAENVFAIKINIKTDKIISDNPVKKKYLLSNFAFIILLFVFKFDFSTFLSAS